MLPCPEDELQKTCQAQSVVQGLTDGSPCCSWAACASRLSATLDCADSCCCLRSSMAATDASMIPAATGRGSTRALLPMHHVRAKSMLCNKWLGLAADGHLSLQALSHAAMTMPRMRQPQVDDPVLTLLQATLMRVVRIVPATDCARTECQSARAMFPQRLRLLSRIAPIPLAHQTHVQQALGRPQVSHLCAGGLAAARAG